MGWLKKITKPISKVLDKVIPNEVKPFLPYISAIAPYMLPPGVGQGLASIGIRNPLLQRALVTGGINLGSQLAQEGSEGDFSGISLGLAGLQGALTAPGAAGYFKGKQVLENYNPELAGLGKGQAAVGEQLSTLDKVKNIGFGALEKGAEFAGGVSKTLQDPFGGTLTEFGKAASVPFIQGSTDLAMSTARKALKDYEDELAAFNLQAGQTQEASNSARRAAIISSMTAAKFSQDIIDDTLSQLGLKDGGRVGYKDAGFVTLKDLGITKRTELGFPYDKSEYTLKDFDVSKEAPKVIIMNEKGETEIMDEKLAKKLGAKIIVGSFDTEQMLVGEKKANGGIMNAKRGLVNAPGGYAGEKGKGISIGIGEFYPDMAKQRAGEFIDFFKLENLKKVPEGIGNFLGEAGSNLKKLESPVEAFKNMKAKYSEKEEGFGGIPEAVKNVEEKPKTFLVDKLKVTVQPGESQEKAILNAMYNDVDDIMPQDRKEEFYRLFLPKLRERGEISEKEYKALMEEVFSKAKGGIIGLKTGGSVLPYGIEMDYRMGGFIPMGSQERADDVPARVSKNEFVMTADAVRGAGGGNINKGAKRMYDLMNNLEARV